MVNLAIIGSIPADTLHWGLLEEMNAIKTYNDTLIELTISKNRLEYLNDKMDEIRNRYLGLKGVNYDKLPTDTIQPYKEKVIEYMDAISKVQSNGMTIEQESEILKTQMVKLQLTLNKMEKHLAHLNGVESKLYKAIVIDGLKITNAVDRVMQQEHYEERQVWKYYKNVKPLIVDLRKAQKKQD